MNEWLQFLHFLGRRNFLVHFRNMRPGMQQMCFAKFYTECPLSLSQCIVTVVQSLQVCTSDAELPQTPLDLRLTVKFGVIF